MRRLLLVRHAATACVRSARFPLDEPLDEPGWAEAKALGPSLADYDWASTSPARRARETAEAAELVDAETDELLRECDFGAWAGRSLRQVSAADPDGLRAWFEDPSARPHGGESLAMLAERVRAFLAHALGREGTGVAVTHGGPIKAAIALTLDAPLSSFWRIDVAPASISELRAREGRWTVARVNWQPPSGASP